METKAERFYIHSRKLYFTFWSNYYKYYNTYLKGQWHCLEEKAVFFGLKPKGSKWFDFEDWHYDGHVCKAIVFAGIAMGYVYGYNAQPLDQETST